MIQYRRNRIITKKKTILLRNSVLQGFQCCKLSESDKINCSPCIVIFVKIQTKGKRNRHKLFGYGAVRICNLFPATPFMTLSPLNASMQFKQAIFNLGLKFTCVI